MDKSGAVLVVDANQGVLELITTILEKYGHPAIASPDAARALTAFHRKPSDIALVLTEVDLPGMTGFSLAARPLQVGTTYGFIAKPFWVADLVAAVRGAIEKSRPPLARAAGA